MPNYTNKTGAVPFVNEKGERSMKRVKIERYVAGKKPSYAQDQEEEYYTTDEEEDPDNVASEEDLDEEDEDAEDDVDEKPHTSHRLRSVIANNFRIREPSLDRSRVKEENVSLDEKDREEEDDDNDDNDDDDDDDPRFRRLKQIQNNKSAQERAKSVSSGANVHTIEPRVKAIEEDEDEEEDAIRQRHLLARSRKLEEPLGPQAVLGEADNLLQDNSKFIEEEARTSRLIDTDDLLMNFMPTAMMANELEERDQEELGDQLNSMLEEAKEEAILRAAVDKRVEEDINREEERLARSKAGDVSATDINSVNTDDEEDDDSEYEAWKLREINRLQRDRAERLRLRPNAQASY